MKTKILCILLLNCLLTGMSFAQCKIDSIITNNYISGTSAKEAYSCLKYYYDSKDSSVGLDSKLWNNVSNQWVNNFKESYILNANGKITQIFTESWQYNQWSKQSKIDVTLDVNGLPTLYLNHIWDSSSNAYKPYSRQFIVYKSANQTSQSLRQVWDYNTSSWVNNSKSDLIYDSKNFRTGQITSNWDVDSGKWINYFKVDWRNNHLGYALGNKFYRWNCNSGCQWELTDSTQYYLNENYRDTANYRSSNGQYFQKTLSSYTNNNCLEKVIYYFFDNSLAKLTLGSEDIFTYKNRSTEIAPVENNALKVYPNPANSLLTIENAEGDEVFITDIITGQNLIHTSVVGGMAKIDISHLNNGLYLIKLGNTIQKIIIQH